MADDGPNPLETPCTKTRIGGRGSPFRSRASPSHVLPTRTSSYRRSPSKSDEGQCSVSAKRMPTFLTEDQQPASMELSEPLTPHLPSAWTTGNGNGSPVEMDWSS